MKANIQQIQEIVSVLANDEQQLLKDTINNGFWGDCDCEFLKEDGTEETVSAYGYCTNDAQDAGNFKGHIVSSMFRSIYKKLCAGEGNRIGRQLSHCNDWWEDGSGDMLFIRAAEHEAFEEWANF